MLRGFGVQHAAFARKIYDLDYAGPHPEQVSNYKSEGGFMTKLTLGAGDWVVVCDGKKALILENVGDRKFPNLRTKTVTEHELQRIHDMGTDVPGRVHASVGTARSATEQADWHLQAENDFLKNLAAELHAAVTSGKVKHIVIVAPPRALGVLRKASSSPLRAATSAELAHDLVMLPLHEIESHLFG